VEEGPAARSGAPAAFGHLLVDVPERKDMGAVLYARVSSADQKADLDRQVARFDSIQEEA